jgi:hypothetical protein
VFLEDMFNGDCVVSTSEFIIYATNRKEDYVLRKLQRGLSAIETWCERWNIRINEDKTQAIYFSHRLRPPETHHIIVDTEFELLAPRDSSYHCRHRI